MIRRVKNRHGSALAACDKWLAGSLSGTAIRLGPDKFHVYGCWKYKRLVDVEFQADCIWIVNGVRCGPNADEDDIVDYEDDDQDED
jgi:hypothetical protein